MNLLKPKEISFARPCKEQIDAYDYGVSYNPFKIFNDGDLDENRYIRSND